MNKNFDINQIRHLLSLYYDGETTVEQEQILTEYFTCNDNIPDEFTADKQLFIALKNSQQELYQNTPQDIENQFADFIDELAKKESKPRFKFSTFYRIATAACITLVLGIGIYSVFNKTNLNIQDDYLLAENTYIITDEKEAYETTQMALMLLSQNLNKSNNAINNTNTKINDINNKLKNILK